MTDHSPEPTHHRDDRRSGSRTAIRVLVGAAGGASVLLGVAIVGLTTLLGHCSAFGGRCPDDPGPLLENDVFGGVVGGLALVTVPVVLWRRHTWRGRLGALAVAVPAWVVLGLLAVDWAAG